jgi:hypothetical protein
MKSLTEAVEKSLKKIGETISKPILALLCIIFGTLVILIPALLRIIVGIFLIIESVLLLTEHVELQRQQQSKQEPPPPPAPPPHRPNKLSLSYFGYRLQKEGGEVKTVGDDK